MKVLKILCLCFLIVISSGSIIVFSGTFIAADKPHSKLVYWLLEKIKRESSIAKASANIQVPDLSDYELLLTGGADYGFMCADCHLSPGQKESDMSLGLYPAPTNLSLTYKQPANIDVARARNFGL